jgi:hypothetical protein
MVASYGWNLRGGAMKFTEEQIKLMESYDDIFRRLDQGECINFHMYEGAHEMYKEWTKQKREAILEEKIRTGEK